MPIASDVQKLRVDTLSIIADAQPKNTFTIRDVGFDVICMGVMECVAQGLARDAIDVVTKNRMEFPRRAFY
jgi:hypothetical protein